MDKETREYLKNRLDREARARVERGWMNCDPEYLTIRAMEARELGHEEVAEALEHFRDRVVNTLIGEGWTVERIEAVAYKYWHVDGKA